MKSFGKKSKNAWKEVKISGQLATDDTLTNLEGFIGLEVLENYDKQFVVKGKPGKSGKKRQSEDDESPTKNPKKKVKKGQEKSGESEQKITEKSNESSNDEEEDSNVGRFVRISRDHEEDAMLTIEDLEDWQSFGLKEPLLQAIAENGFRKPTEIQSLTLPAALMGRRDILGAAETGSGKTLAFGLPILNGIMELQEKEVENPDVKLRKTVKIVKGRQDRDNLTPPPEEVSDEEEYPVPEQIRRKLYALILTPTRELAVQVRDHIKAVAVHTGVRVVAIFGGLALVKQERLLRQCPEIVVATPGRFWELLKEGNAHLNKVDDISFLAIDETDRMMEKGHFEELTLLLERINRIAEKKAQRQNFVFSATLTLVHDLPDYLKFKNMGKKKKAQKITSEKKLESVIEILGISQPKVVDVTKASGTAEHLTECRIVCSLTEKDYYLYYFLQCHPGRTIVFCNSIDCVRRLAHLFSLLQCRSLPLHASMAQKQRLKNLERFRDDAEGLLIATDVAARGLDIPNVQHVIHYQVPRTSENYVHRSGRTARASREGITVLLMEPSEVECYSRLCRTLGRSEDLPVFPINQRLLTAVKDRVILARQVDEMDLRERRTQKEVGWREKAAREIDMILSESDSEAEDHRVERKQRHEQEKKALKEKHQQLSKLLAKPLFPKGYSYKYPTAAGRLEMPAMRGQDAVDVMKAAIQSGKESSKVIKKAMKPKRKKVQQKNQQQKKKD
ncbi:ATP-dependent RNA helicase DDX24 [Phlebotomus argentipes]|uniref:ATP-dependent RNA helicase DDX24 n=1 Tax=Phlebotomus argentipes TaxID=94469 RepID=UPI00289348DC|nr:ATP-dependent RNA helicase DDX24 [Phlebotomus argentipes]